MRRGFPALQSRLNHTIGSTFNRSSKFNRVDSLLFTFSSSKLTTLSSQFELCPAPVKSSCVHPPSFLFSRSTWNLSQCVMSMNAYAGKRNYSSQEHGKSGSGDDGPRGTKDYEDNSKKRSWRMSSIFKLIRSQWFTISIPIMGYACAMYPEYMSTGGQFSSEKWKDFVIAGVFFMGGLSIRGIDELLGRSTGSFRVPFQGHVFIQVFSLLLIPAVICATVPYLPSLGIDLPTHCYLGIIFTGCLPTTIGAGVVLTRAAAGDTVLALLHSAIGNIVGSVLCPITILLTTGLEPTVPLERVVKQIGGLILMPVFGGMLLRSICSLSVANSLNHYSGTVQQLLLLLLLSTVFSNTFNMSDKQVATGGDDPMKMIGPLMGVMGMYFSSFFLVAWFASRAKFLGMQHESRIAASFCATQKTAALGVPMLQVLFNGDPNLHLLSLPLLCYHPLQAILGALFVPFIKRPLK